LNIEKLNDASRINDKIKDEVEEMMENTLDEKN